MLMVTISTLNGVYPLVVFDYQRAYPLPTGSALPSANWPWLPWQSQCPPAEEVSKKPPPPGPPGPSWLSGPGPTPVPKVTWAEIFGNQGEL